jgi:hypothetical protein
LLVNLALRFGGGLEVYAEIKKQPAIAPAAPQVVVGKQKHLPLPCPLPIPGRGFFTGGFFALPFLGRAIHAKQKFVIAEKSRLSGAKAPSSNAGFIRRC